MCNLGFTVTFNNKVKFVKILNALGIMKEQYNISLIYSI